MAFQCDNCGKGVMFGHNVSHAKNRTNRTFKPNLHSVRVLVGTTRMTKKLCTKCQRMYKRLQVALDTKSSQATTTV